MNYQQTLISAIYQKKNTAQLSQGVAIYQNNLQETGIRALGISFPTVAALIGEQSFRYLCIEYLRAQAKQCFDWGEYGASLAAFIDKQSAFDELPFLAEVADFDWHVHQVQRAKDRRYEPQSFALLEHAEPDSVVLQGAPGLDVLRYYFPVIELYQLQHASRFTTDEAARAELLIHVNTMIENAINGAQARSVVVWRANLKAEFTYIDDKLAKVFHLFAAQVPLEQVLLQIQSDELDLTAWLSDVISTKKLFAVTQPNSNK